ncbi:GGDEF domain-containing protein [Oryzibacter oryziterrae]|uniref:GGDEF domain-containing protein n=1 Tax=Oryzibacter oryziterrae TaxID=2766474 RepID=UPI001F17D28B|nr:GGDEF domain-containing protein [Oryzibacter oryziterrae]
MTTELNLTTVLLLQKTAYIAGALVLVYLRAVLGPIDGVRQIGASFLILALGSTLAGYAEIDHLHYSLFSLINVVAGVLAYSMFGLGMVRLSSRRSIMPSSYIFVPAGVTFVAGLISHFHEFDSERAITFNLVAGFSLGLSGLAVYLDRKREPLQVRVPLSAVLLALSLLCLVIVYDFVFGNHELISPASGLFVLIGGKFLLSMLIVLLIGERQHVQLVEIANTDGLTGVRNRRYFDQHVPQALRAGDAILLLDIDHFKSFNDRWGHAVGDEVLRSVAQTIRRTVSPLATVARYGGEEFALHLPQRAGSGVSVAEAIRGAVESQMHTSDTIERRVTVSIGLAVATSPHHALSDLCREADQALYAAKNAGRNRVHEYVERIRAARIGEAA